MKKLPQTHLKLITMAAAGTKPSQAHDQFQKLAVSGIDTSSQSELQQTDWTPFDLVDDSAS